MSLLLEPHLFRASFMPKIKYSNNFLSAWIHTQKLELADIDFEV